MGEYEVRYGDAVKHLDIPALDRNSRKRIEKAILTKLFTKPEIFGKPLQQQLFPFRSLRVGEYRIVYRVQKKMVSIMAILHRSIVYKEAVQRLSTKD